MSKHNKHKNRKKFFRSNPADIGNDNNNGNITVALNNSEERQQHIAIADGQLPEYVNKDSTTNTQADQTETEGYPHELQGTPHHTAGYPHQPGGTPHDTEGYPHQPQGTPHDSGGYPHEPWGTPHDTGGTPRQPWGNSNESKDSAPATEVTAYDTAQTPTYEAAETPDATENTFNRYLGSEAPGIPDNAAATPIIENGTTTDNITTTLQLMDTNFIHAHNHPVANYNANKSYAPIGVFDSGYGGLTVFEKIQQLLPAYDFVYLGDNARAPYGNRSFEIVYQFTKQAVKFLFQQGCPLVILACNTASAKALRTIQQVDLPNIDPNKRVLGVIRPTVEAVDSVSKSKHVGIFATQGTVASQSYELELQKLFPHIKVTSEACPMWVPLIENNAADEIGAACFIQRNVDSLVKKDKQIDTVILGCTHYPLIKNKIKLFLPGNVTILEQGTIVAKQLKNYLERHPDINEVISKQQNVSFLTTEDTNKFKDNADSFLQQTTVESIQHVDLV